MEDEDRESSLTMINVDWQLKLTHPEFEDSATTVECSSTTAKDLLASISEHPSHYILAKFACIAYDDWEIDNYHEKLKDLPGWTFLTAAYRKKSKVCKGYYGVAFWNRDARQVVVAHRNTASVNFGNITSNITNQNYKKYSGQINSAVTFVSIIKKFIEKLNGKSKINFQLFITGHSTAGLLAQVTAFSFRYLMEAEQIFGKEKEQIFIKEKDPIYCHHAVTVTFDSPGCKVMLERMEQNFDVRFMFAKSSVEALDITNYVTDCDNNYYKIFHVGELVYSLNIDGKNENGKINHNMPSKMIAVLSLFDEKTNQLKLNETAEISDSLKKEHNNRYIRTNAFSSHEYTFLRLYNQFVKKNQIEDIFKEHFVLEAPIEIHKMLTMIRHDKAEDMFFILNEACTHDLAIPYLRGLLQYYNGIDCNEMLVHRSCLINQRTEQFTRAFRASELQFADDSLNLLPFLSNKKQKLLLIKVNDSGRQIVHKLIHQLTTNNKVFDVILTSDLMAELILKNVMICVTDEPDISAACEGKVRQFLSVMKKKKIIFIGRETDEYLSSLKEIMFKAGLQDDEIKTVKETQTEWKDLTTDSRDLLLAKKVILFKDQMVSLQDLISVENPIIHKLIENCPEIVDKLIEDQIVSIREPEFPIMDGMIVKILDDNTKMLSKKWNEDSIIETTDMQDDFTEFDFKRYCSHQTNRKQKMCWIRLENDRYAKWVYDPLLYCTRKLVSQQKVIIKESSLRNKKCILYKDQDVIIFQSEDEKEQFEDEMEYSESSIDGQFSKLPEGCGCVYWTKKHNSLLFLHKSHGSLNHIRSIMKSEKYEVIKEEEFFRNVTNNDTVIVGDPGSGKSTIMTRIGSEFCNTHWVIPISLNKCQKSIDHMSPETAASFLVDAGAVAEKNCDVSIIRDVIKCKLENSLGPWPLLLLFDGFDEIQGAERKIKVLELIQHLKHKARICVTSSFLHKKQLENCLSVFSTAFLTLDTSQPAEYLRKLWTYQLGSEIDQPLTEKFAAELINKAKRPICNINEEQRHSLGIPLQVQLLAEGFRNNLHELLVKTVKPESLQFEQLNITTVFKKFVKMKFSTFLEEEYGVSPAHPSLFVDNMSSSFLKIHQSLALRAFMENNDLESSELFNLNIKNYTDEVCSIGLIRSFNNGTPDFVHKVIYEYFVAECLYHFTRKMYVHPAHKVIMEILFTNILINPENAMIRIFFNELLLENPTREGVFGYFYGCTWDQNDRFCNAEGETALHVCVKEGHDEIFKYILMLLKKYPLTLEKLVPIQDAKGNTFLNVSKYDYIDNFLSCCSGLNVIQKLLFSTTFRCDHDVKSPSLDELLKRCENFDNVRDIATQIRKDWKLVDPFLFGAKQESTENIEKTLSEASDETKLLLPFINGKNRINDKKSMCSPIHMAAERGSIKIVQFFLNPAGNELKKRFVECHSSFDRKTPLHYAAKGGDLDVVKCLLHHGAEVNACTVDSDGKKNKTPLHLAAKKGHLEIVKFLVENGANVNARTRSGGSTIHLVIKANKMQILEYLVEQTDCELGLKDHAGINGLTASVRHGNYDIVSYLLSKCRSIQEVNTDGIYHAMQKNRWSIFEMLVKSGVDINAPMGKKKSALDLLKTMQKQDYVDKIIKLSKPGENNLNN